MKLWDKGAAVDKRILDYTVGEDPQLDLKLLPYDCQASIAHAEMLGKIGILRANEVKALTRELQHIAELAAQGKFPITRAQEDGHTAIENYLTEKLGEVGKKIHTGRSRNDQVLTALRLFYLAELREIDIATRHLRKALRKFVREYGNIPMPGFTHTRKAMPSTVGMWAGALSDALKDDRVLLRAARKLVDQSPLGTGAGYGVPLEIDRKYTAERLGFSRVQKNPVYAQNSRGKFESTILHALTQIMANLNKFAGDLILFSLPEFGFFELPEALCTGSSIMPQKQNPDVLELVRSHYHTLLGYEVEIKSRMANLISGYHRDMQLSKGPVMRGLQITRDSLAMMQLVFEKMRVNKANCRAAMTEELFATEAAYRLVKQGVPFREAYRQIGAQYRQRKNAGGKPPDG